MGIYDVVLVPCFVCEVEDELKEERGTQSHPINCGWRRERERAGYVKALEQIYNICQGRNDTNEIREIVVKALVGRYDIKEGTINEETNG